MTEFAIVCIIGIIGYTILGGVMVKHHFKSNIYKQMKEDLTNELEKRNIIISMLLTILQKHNLDPNEQMNELLKKEKNKKEEK